MGFLSKIYWRSIDKQKFTDVSLSEYSGFEEFFNTYYKDKHVTQQNKYILSIFPNSFWERIDVSLEDTSKYADTFFLSDDNQEFTKAVVASKDPWLLKNGVLIHSALYGVTLWNKGLMKNENFRNKCADIVLAELQILGIKMLALLPKDEQKKFLDECAEHYPPSVEPDFAFLALRMWADFVCTLLAEKHGLVSTPAESFPKTHLSDIVGKIGFIATIVWLRELTGPDYRNFDKYVQQFSSFLLDVQSLKNYIMFDSVFFPYIGKRR